MFRVLRICHLRQARSTDHENRAFGRAQGLRGSARKWPLWDVRYLGDRERLRREVGDDRKLSWLWRRRVLLGNDDLKALGESEEAERR